jgi:protoheme IX farnesyltransferase
MFLWTPPHFWALAIRYRDDYAAAEVPMLPVVASLRVTSERILTYTVVLWAMTLVVAPVARTGPIYTVAALVLGAAFVWFANELRRLPTPANAMRLFGFSITYVTLLFAAIAVDTVVRHGW